MLIIISGPSGAGKTPLLYRIMEIYPSIKKVQSYTTRKTRKKEVQGTYVYMTHSQFEQKISEGFFLEYNKVHKDQEYYGTGLDSYKKVINDGFIAIKDIDVDSYKQIRKRKDLEIIGIYVTVKNRGVLFDRLRERGESEKTISIRLHDRVDYENAQSKYYDHVVYTDNFEQASSDVEKFLDEEFKRRKLEVKKVQDKDRVFKKPQF